MTKATKKKSYSGTTAVDKDVGEPTVFPTEPIDEHEHQELDEKFQGDDDDEPAFYISLEFDDLPTWDGNPDDLIDYLNVVDYMSSWSPRIYVQLGKYLPFRFTGAAQDWWFCVRPAERKRVQKNWGTLKKLIVDHHMHEGFFEKQCIKADARRFRNWTLSNRDSD